MQVKGPEGAWQGMTNKCGPIKHYKHQPGNQAPMPSCMLASEEYSDCAVPLWMIAGSHPRQAALLHWAQAHCDTAPGLAAFYAMATIRCRFLCCMLYASCPLAACCMLP